MKTRAQRGFSFLELMTAVALLLVISAAAFSLTNYFQKNYTANQMKADMHSGVRGAVELMSQELAQAGLLNSVDGIADTSLAAADLSSGNPQAVGVGNASLFYVGENVQVGTGATSETVQITAIDTNANKITGIFTQNEPAGAPVYATGVIGQGITVTSTTLDLVGDINGDGSLYLVEYVCNPSSTGGTLTRSATPVSQASKNAADVLVTAVTGCSFSSSTTPVNGVNYVTNIGLTITVQTAQVDPQTHQYIQMTKSYLDLSPRNIAGAVALANAGQNARLQATPSPLPQ